MGTHPAERYHGLDALRAFAMFLGVLLHGAVAYTARPLPFWPVHDPAGGPLAELFLLAVHDFRMQTFFVLAGFFGGLLHARYGLAGLLRHRLLRIAVPLAVGAVALGPVLQGLWLVGHPRALPAVGLTAPPADTAASEAVIDHLTSSRFLAALQPMHLWFLYFLVIYFLAAGPVLAVVVPLARTRVGRGFDAGFGRLLGSPLAVPVLAALTVPLLWPMETWTADTPGGWLPPARVLAYYAGFFAFGWLLFRHRDRLTAFTRRWPTLLLAGHLLALPARLGLLLVGLEYLADKQLPRPDWFPLLKLGALAAGALYTWLTIVGLTGLFLHRFSRPSATVRYLADASYWCYLASLPPLVALQMLFEPLPLPGLVKFLAVVGLTTAGLLVSYQWCVRYTAVGTLLNGPRTRPGADTAPALEAEPVSGR